jgi:hypothetical protein
LYLVGVIKKENLTVLELRNVEWLRIDLTRISHKLLSNPEDPHLR